mgnify:CR=1 FL=1
MGVEKEKLQEFAVIEMMGHRKIVGKITESDIAAGSLLKVSVLGKDGKPERTEYIGVGSIYCLTIVTEEAAMAAAAKNAPEPTWAWNLPQRPALPSGYIDADDDDDFDPDDED